MAFIEMPARDPHEPRKPAPLCEQLPPPRSMPGYCCAIPLDEHHPGLAAALVIEMAWAEQFDSDSYIRQVPFGVGARILFSTGLFGGIVNVDGYLIVPVHTVVAWTPAPELA